VCRSLERFQSCFSMRQLRPRKSKVSKGQPQASQVSFSPFLSLPAELHLAIFRETLKPHLEVCRSLSPMSTLDCCSLSYLQENFTYNPLSPLSLSAASLQFCQTSQLIESLHLERFRYLCSPAQPIILSTRCGHEVI